jgi:hypothetical protein
LSPCLTGNWFGSLFGNVAGVAAAWGQRALHAVGAVQDAGRGLQKLGEGDWIGGILDLVQAGVNIRGMMRSCFTAEMPVLTDADGTAIRCDAVRVGDFLLSCAEDDPAGPLVRRRVEEVFERLGRILHVKVRERVIRTTAEHPFWVRDKQAWVPAGELEVGDVFRSHDGQWVTCAGVEDTGEYEKVYNFRVAEDHTYFVGGRDWSFSVWAHNSYTARLEDGDRVVAGRTLRDWASEYIDVASQNPGKRPSWSKIAPGNVHRGSALNRFEQGMVRKWAETFMGGEMSNAGVKIKVHNEDGGLGDPVSKRTGTYAANELEKRGFTIFREERFDTPGSSEGKAFRKMDVYAVNQATKEVVIVQVVRTSNQAGTTPLSRESPALLDVLASPRYQDLVGQGYSVAAHMMRRGSTSLDQGVLRTFGS